MKRRILGLLLTLAMLAGMVTVAMAADEEATLALDLRCEQEELVVTLRLSGGEGVTNGRVCLRYDAKAAQLVSRSVLAACGEANVNAETEGEISLAWVGSAFEKEEKLLEVRFAFTGDVALSAKALELYADKTKLAAKEASAHFAENPFTDIGTHWAKEEILKATRAGLFKGETETTFCPNNTLTRAMFVTVLHRLAGEPEASIASLRFTDIRKDEYYAEALAWAVENGIVTGHSDRIFAPNDPVTRQEMAVMLYRYAKFIGADVSETANLSKFADAKKIDQYAAEAMAWAVGSGLLRGYPDATLGPKKGVTRAETAVLLCRFAGL